MAGKTKVTGNWPDFLRDPSKKQELYPFLSEMIASTAFPDEKLVFASSGGTVVYTGNDHCMPPCDHEEVDTIIVVHLQDVPESRCTTCLMRTVNADVVAILIAKYTSFSD